MHQTDIYFIISCIDWVNIMQLIKLSRSHNIVNNGMIF